MRIKRGQAKHLKHKRILKAAKGYYLTYRKLFKRANEAVLHAGQYSYAHRQHRRSQLRQTWIKIIAAGLAESGVSYKDFIHNLKQKNIELDRKVLAEIAQANPEHFSQLVQQASA